MTGAVVRIRRYGHRCLRRRARPVDPLDARTRTLLDSLWATLDDEGGVGLAAPQIGRDCRVVVVRDPDRPPGGGRLELVNPVIRKTFGPSVPFEEGCLSFPGLYIQVWRHRGVEVEFDGPQGRRTLRDDALVSRIIQHEVDHLDGVLFIDRLSRRQRMLVLPRLLPFVLFEFWRKMFRKVRDD